MSFRDYWVNIIFLTGFLSALLLAFGNCGKVQFAESVEKASVEGDQTSTGQSDDRPDDGSTDTSTGSSGTNVSDDSNDDDDYGPNNDYVVDIQPPEQCVSGKRLGIWLDPLDLGQKFSANYLGSIVAYEGDLSAKDNYNYYSASAHPVVGPQPEPFSANVFFYEGSDGELALNFFSNIDEGGSDQSRFVWEVKTSGNDLKDDVIVSDDPNHQHILNSSGAELKVDEVDEASKEKFYSGNFEFYNNTDGGVIGPFQGDTYIIRVQVKKSDEDPIYPLDVNSARFFSADGSAFSLSTDDDVFSSFIIGYQTYENCSGI